MEVDYWWTQIATHIQWLMSFFSIFQACMHLLRATDTIYREWAKNRHFLALIALSWSLWKIDTNFNFWFSIQIGKVDYSIQVWVFPQALSMWVWMCKTCFCVLVFVMSYDTVMSCKLILDLRSCSESSSAVPYSRSIIMSPEKDSVRLRFFRWASLRVCWQ